MSKVYETEHFCILGAWTQNPKWVKKGFGNRYKIALIEKSNGVAPTKIDPRQKAFKRLIRWRYYYQYNHNYHTPVKSWKCAKANHRMKREMIELAKKAERVWPCTFMIKGFPPTYPIDNPLWYWDL